MLTNCVVLLNVLADNRSQLNERSAMKKITKEAIRQQMIDNPRWMLIGLITIYKHQTASEQQARTTSESNGVGFNGPDSKSLSTIAGYLVNKYGEMTIRMDKNATLEKYLDKSWAREAVAKKMPKYAGQLAKLANEKLANKVD